MKLAECSELSGVVAVDQTQMAALHVAGVVQFVEDCLHVGATSALRFGAATGDRAAVRIKKESGAIRRALTF